MIEPLIEMLGEDDFTELQSEVNAIMKDPNRSNIDRYLDAEKLLNEWGVDPDRMNELIIK